MSNMQNAMPIYDLKRKRKLDIAPLKLKCSIDIQLAMCLSYDYGEWIWAIDVIYGKSGIVQY